MAGQHIDVDTLHAFSLFDGMTDAELETCATLFEPIKRLPGERVTREDDFGYSLFLVISGRLRVDTHGEEVAEIAAGDFFGEVSLVTGKRRNATVTALEMCELAKIMTWDFSELLERNPMLAGRIKVVAEQRTNE